MPVAAQAQPNSPVEVTLRDASLLYATPALWFRRRGQRVLVAEMETASWMVVPQRQFSLLRQLEEPLTFAELVERNPDLPPAEVLRAVEAFYQQQMLSIDGRHRYNPAELWAVKDFPYFITIHLTERCNFACTYCYGEYTTKGKRAKLETVKYIIRRVFQEIPLPQVAIEYHGGEPLMEFDILVEASKFARSLARKTGKKLFIMAQSNGSLVTPERAALLKELNVNVGVSMDGTRRLHDRHRINYAGKGTFDKVMAGMEALKDAGHGVGPLCVVSEPEHYKETYDFFLENGITDMTLRRVYGSGRARDSVYVKPDIDDDFARAFLESVERLCDTNTERGPGAVRLREVENTLANIVSKRRYHMCFRSPCGAGNAHIAFDVHGNYYACDEMVGRETFKIGNIYEDDHLARTMSQSSVCSTLKNRTVQNLPKCRRCPWKFICGGGCASRVETRFGTINKESHFCRFQELTIEELMWKIDEKPEMVELVMGPRFMEQDEIMTNQYKL